MTDRADPTPRPEDLALAARLRERLEERRWTQKKLAQVSGVHPAEINNVLAGRRTPQLRRLRELARALGVSVDWLVNGPATA